jgi:hypothetical protein
MKFKIGVMGSSKLPQDKRVQELGKEIGRQIARNNCVLVNGATTGMPFMAALGAQEESGFVLGISPASNHHEHVKVFDLPDKCYDAIIYTGFGFNLRNIVNIRTSDGLIFLKGSMGTLNEFTIAYEDNKIIGVLEGIGGVSQHFKHIIKICNKRTDAKVIFDSDPEQLVKRVYKEILRRH